MFPSTIALLRGRTSPRSSSHASSPMASQGASAAASVRSSMCWRRAAPASVKAPSALTKPRAASSSTAACHASSRHPRVVCNAARETSPDAAWKISASRPPRRASTKVAMCPSPRNSRVREMACQRARCGASGHGRLDCPANSGRPSGVHASAAARASVAARATSGPSTVSPKARRNAASAAESRALVIAAGAAEVWRAERSQG